MKEPPEVEDEKYERSWSGLELGVGQLLCDVICAPGLLRSPARVRPARRRWAVHVDLLPPDGGGCPAEGGLRAWRAGRPARAITWLRVRSTRSGRFWRSADEPGDRPDLR